MEHSNKIKKKNLKKSYRSNTVHTMILAFLTCAF